MDSSGAHSRQYCNGLLHAPSIEHRKKSWSELKESVTDLRKQLSRLATMIPMNIEFRRLSDGRTRIYFLSTPPKGWETTLLCTDIPLSEGSISCDTSQLSQKQRLMPTPNR